MGRNNWKHKNSEIYLAICGKLTQHLCIHGTTQNILVEAMVRSADCDEILVTIIEDYRRLQ